MIDGLFWLAEGVALAALGGLAFRQWRQAAAVPAASVRDAAARRRSQRRPPPARARDASGTVEDGGPGRRAVLEDIRPSAPLPEFAVIDPLALYDAMAVQRGIETTVQARGEIARLLEQTRKPGARQVNTLVDRLDQRVQTRLNHAIAEPAGKDESPAADKPESAPARRQPPRRPILRRRRLRHLVTVTPTDVRAVSPEFLEAERVAEAEAVALDLMTSRPSRELRHGHAPGAPRPR